MNRGERTRYAVTEDGFRYLATYRDFEGFARYSDVAESLGKGFEGKNPSVMRLVADKTAPPAEVERIAKEVSVGLNFRVSDVSE